MKSGVPKVDPRLHLPAAGGPVRESHQFQPEMACAQRQWQRGTGGRGRETAQYQAEQAVSRADGGLFHWCVCACLNMLCCVMFGVLCYVCCGTYSFLKSAYGRDDGRKKGVNYGYTSR